MKTYVVGGAVRDRLLGLAVRDRDHVVVGATLEQMTAAGFVPVGRDFPVFLHPDTHDEYALARTERKSGRGYQGFVFQASSEVTLEQDLARRDLTINAMAEDEDGSLIDPYGGLRDLRAKVLRHVGEAFAEDPVRILRVARFAARFDHFSIAPETLVLMRHMVAIGEVNHLVAERVWQEMARGLMEHHPSRMFAVLRDCGALIHIAPQLDHLWRRGEAQGGLSLASLIDHAAGRALPLQQRFALLMHGATRNETQALCALLRVPNEARDLALMLGREQAALGAVRDADAAALLALFERCDALRRPERFSELVMTWSVLAEALGVVANRIAASVDALRLALAAARAVDAGEVVRPLAASPEKIPQAVRAARLQAIADIAGTPL